MDSVLLATKLRIPPQPHRALRRARLLTDLSGSFDTVVQELEVESLAEWERLRAVIFSNPEVQAAEAALPDIIVSGQAEYYTIEGAY